MPASLPRSLYGTSFRVSEAESLGLTPSRVRSCDLDAPFHGVRSVGLELSTVRERCRAYLPLLRSDQFFSHTTAAALHGTPLPASLLGADDVLHIAAFAPRTPPRRRGVAGHRVTHRPGSVIEIDGLPVAPFDDVWCQLASFISREDLVAAGDHLLGARATAADDTSRLDALTAALRRHAGGRGMRNLVWALPRLRAGAGSRAESLLRLALVAAGLPEPLVQHPLHFPDGIVRHADLAYPEWRIAIEYEGDVHRVDRRQWMRDIARRELFESSGWRVIRVTALDLARPAELASRIRGIISSPRSR